MKISFIIPVYNVEKYLEECISSVLTLNIDFEVILVDDGSTDSSGLLCDNWAEKDERIKVIHQKNGGLSSARNTGIQHSSGDYMVFLDSDDFIDSAETEKMISFLSDDVDVLMGLYRNYFTETQSCVNESCDAFLSIRGRLSVDEFLKVVPLDGRSCYMTAWRFVVNREFILKNKLFFMPGIYHEDEEWTARVFFAAKKIEVTHCYFYQYRQARAGAITSSVKPKHIGDKFIILNEINGLRCQLDGCSVKFKYFRSRMCQLFLSNLIYLRILNGDAYEKGIFELEKYSDICVPYLSGKLGVFLKCMIKIFGIRKSCMLIYFFRNVLGIFKRRGFN